MFALVTPFFFIETDHNDTIRELTLVYEFIEGSYIDELDYVYESRFDNLIYIASPDNMEIVLRTNYYEGFPLAVDVSSWGLSQDVSIGLTPATVVDELSIAGYDCWKCETSYNSFVCFDKVTGIYVHSYWIDEDGNERIIVLEEIFFEERYPYLRRAGVLVSGIFIELAVIIWLIADRLKKSK